jgi:hypothetical protein
MLDFHFALGMVKRKGAKGFFCNVEGDTYFLGPPVLACRRFYQWQVKCFTLMSFGVWIAERAIENRVIMMFSKP